MPSLAARRSESNSNDIFSFTNTGNKNSNTTSISSTNSSLAPPLNRQETLATNGLNNVNGYVSSVDDSAAVPQISIPTIIIGSHHDISGAGIDDFDGAAPPPHASRVTNKSWDIMSIASAPVQKSKHQQKSSPSSRAKQVRYSHKMSAIEHYNDDDAPHTQLRKTNSVANIHRRNSNTNNNDDEDDVDHGQGRRYQYQFSHERSQLMLALSRTSSRLSVRKPTFLSVKSITAADSISYVGDDDDDSEKNENHSNEENDEKRSEANSYSDIANTHDLDDEMFIRPGDGGAQNTAAGEQNSSVGGWTRTIHASWTAHNTFNPIRAIVDKMNVKPNPAKPVLSLSIGDPTFYGNMTPAQQTIDAVRDALMSGKYHGYTPAAGLPIARECVAKHLNVFFDPPSGGHALQADDIFLSHGCSHALELALTVLCDSGKSNVLLPRPGFPIYTTLSMSRDVECRSYRLLPEENFQADLEQMDELIDENTAAIVVTNPANPCGSVYSRQHLLDIVKVARKHQLPIIADEIYCDFVFDKSTFIPIGSLSDDVPVLSAGGLTKKYIVPGWRLGWVAIYDRDKHFDSEIRGGINALCQRILGPCSLIQGALPAILTHPPLEHVKEMIAISERNAHVAYKAISQMPGVRCSMPQGAMYMMVEILVKQFDGTFTSDVDFSWMLMSEQSVYCLPGSIFGSNNFIRLVLTLPDDKMHEAMLRMCEFCTAHYVGEHHDQSTEQSNDEEGEERNDDEDEGSGDNDGSSDGSENGEVCNSDDEEKN